MILKLKTSHVLSFIFIASLSTIGLQGLCFEETSLRDDANRAVRNRLNQELLPLFQQTNIEERIQTYLTGGGDPNLANDAGLTFLHIAAYYGRQELVSLLVNSHNANACTADASGFLAGDYVRMALIKGTLSNVSIRTLLNESETVNFERRVSTKPFIGEFMQAFERKCDELHIATQVLNSGKVARALNYLEPAMILNFLGNMIPLPGAGIVAQGGAMVADHLVEQQEQARRDQYIRNAPAELSREFKKLAYALSYRYEDPIQNLTDQGAKSFGEYCAEKIQEYLTTEMMEKDQNQSFTYHVLDYLGTLPTKDGLRRTMVPLQKGGSWRAKNILRGDSDIPNSKWPLRKINEDAVVSSVEQEEIARIELLLSVEVPGYGENFSERIQPVAQPKHIEVMTLLTEKEKKRTAGVGKGAINAHVKKDAKLDFTSGSTAEVPDSDDAVGIGFIGLKVDGDLDVKF